MANTTPESALESIIKHLKSEEAQKRLDNFLQQNTVGELLRLFEELPDNLLHPEIDQIFAKIEAENLWDKLGYYLNDLVVIAYQELFDSNGNIKDDIKNAINIKDTNKFQSLVKNLGEEQLKTTILSAYLQKMFLISCAPYLSKKIQQNEEMQHFVSDINKEFSNFSDSLNFNECQHLTHKCIAVGKSISNSFRAWEDQYYYLISDHREVETLIYSLKNIAMNADIFILPGEIRECETLIDCIKQKVPDFPFGSFEQIVDNGFETIMKKEFDTHRSHTQKAFFASALKHNLKEELKQLKNDLNDELIKLEETLNIYFIITDEDKDSRDLSYIKDLKQNYEKLSSNLSAIDALAKRTDLEEHDLVSIKLRIMSDTIILSQSEILLQQKGLALRTDEEPQERKIKIDTLKNFSEHLTKQKDMIDAKLLQPRVLKREDISERINAISEKRKEIQKAGFTHRFWLFNFLAKLGFHIQTRTEKTIETAEARLSLGGKPFK